jgi:octaprenyl-diphosphate synthase
MALAAQKLQHELQHTNPNALAALSAYLQEDLDAVNALMIKEMQNDIDLIPCLAGHLFSAGGKCVRPLLTLAAARLCGYQGRLHVLLAACVEFIHTATLLHDDVVDESILRRGKPSANAVWGNQASVLVGDFLFSRAFQLMVQADNMKILAKLANASATIAEGEIMQLMDHGDLDVHESRYLKMVGAKTAALFEAATEIGAILAQSDPEQQAALRQFGANFGICFQIIDDILDYGATQGELGKNIGDDFKEGKVTLPVIYAFHAGSSAEKAFWQEAFNPASALSPTHLLTAQSLLLKYDALEQARHKAQQFGSEACARLNVFADSSLKTKLIDMMQFCVNRSY